MDLNDAFMNGFDWLKYNNLNQSLKPLKPLKKGAINRALTV